ncbi:MAG: nucleotide exchange factor GrpE [Candidatus Levybacteria bacterium]|nr:nucleotide exchange factor GrpE [Candidatus Levybacteria bacterium]
MSKNNKNQNDVEEQVKEVKEDKSENEERDKLKQELEECQDKYKRALADYQNLVKRMQDEKAEWGRFANKELLLRLLPVLDTLMLARQHSQDQTLLVTTQQFLDVLKADGVERIETKDSEFDPHQMEAIDTVEVNPSAGSGQEAGKVIEEVRAGYSLHDTLLRPAQVRVGRGKGNLDDR